VSKGLDYFKTQRTHRRLPLRMYKVQERLRGMRADTRSVKYRNALDVAIVCVEAVLIDLRAERK
jgi:hypothetical protein